MFKPLSVPPAGPSAESVHIESAPLPARRYFPTVSTELLIAVASLFFSLFCNNPLWSALLGGRDWMAPGSWLFAAAAFVIVTAIHALLLALVVNRWTAKPLLTVLFLVSAGVVYYMQHYAVFFDPTMLRNILHTDVKEARELVSFSLLAHLVFYGILPALLLLRVRLAQRGWRRALLMRAGFMFGCVVLIAASMALVFQDLSATMRNQKEARYLITPGNYLTSLVRVVVADTADARAPRLPLGTDATLGAGWGQRRKPALLVLVLGETARAANWGLNGYARQTTPKLAESDVLNFPHVTSCGTNTEVSVPCMFSPYGRKDYDENKIRRHESLLHVLEHGGFKTVWRDNQSGCKGVCDGLQQAQLDNSKHPVLCDGQRCLDEILLENLEADINLPQRNVVVVLHQLGNHGPAYSRRYPEAFRRFTPTCDTAELGKCSQQQIVNSYDNALLYTDHFLDQTISRLKAQTTHDAALIYVSDHGESLGEKGLYLHGLPYSIAPKEQTEVPMIMWLSNSFASSFGLDSACLKKQAQEQVSHDYLFHSILGMLQVTTTVYDKAYDLTAHCHV